MNHAARFAELHIHVKRLHGKTLPQLLADDPQRATEFVLQCGPLYFNFARQSYDRPALDALLAIATQQNLQTAFSQMFDGYQVNTTEKRAALHTALRSNLSDAPAAKDAYALGVQAREHMAVLVAELEASHITDIVSVGIGGSDLGARLVVDALHQPGSGRFRVHFLSNVDGVAAQRVLTALEPSKTAAIIISKTFGTQETLLNAQIVRDWLGGCERMYAVSSNPERAANTFAIPSERVLPMWDWVGGRYSLWSAVGFPIALAIGMQGFEQLLAGAAAMDAHVLNTPLQKNIAVIHALTAIWNRNMQGARSHAVLGYDQRLALLPAYLQQLAMESLGKRVDVNGVALEGDAVPVWWGGVGTDVQHSFFQALHQGTRVVPADFIGIVRIDHPYQNNAQVLLAHLLAQTQALANGQSNVNPHQVYLGSRPNSLILLDALTPYSLGMLLAMYEHSVYAQAVLWGINAFDQFGVELGKQVANGLLPAVIDKTVAVDDVVTSAILTHLHKTLAGQK